ncbi:winged helix-turn-helix transcriptional regulator [candidate division WWE3 bacterium]|nr:winged helix-turn-helix transcriptional regulator [candidate division WWE3 bacterium]
MEHNVRLKALANETRLRLILCLDERKKNVTELINHCGLAQSAVSQHLEKLREAGLIKATRDGREMYYEIADQSLVTVSKQLLDFITTQTE